MSALKDGILKFALKKQRSGKKAFVPWDKVKSALLIIDAKSGDHKQKLDKFIYESDKKWDVVFINLKSKEPIYKNLIELNSKDKNLIGLPNNKAISKISNTSYDLLINAAFEDLEYASILTHKAKAVFKCGFQAVGQELDLVLIREKGRGVYDYLDEMVSYLQMIKN